MVERGIYYQPIDAGLPGAGSEQLGSVANPFDAFVERLAPTGEPPQREERGLQLADPFIPFFLMHSVNERFEGVPIYVDIGFKPTEEQNQMIKNVKLAYGIIVHPFCEMKLSSGKTSHVHQKEIQHVVAIERAYEGRNRVVLTDEERELLIKIATAAGIPIDPKRNEYFFDEIPEGKTLFDWSGEYYLPPIVDAAQAPNR